ncbi:hypothetical protein [Polyangium mundeleinium]|uniref:Alpha/beta hydrolase n=1 Tax=Polyangium mundeleinium TaxID=2995306 RepID=A0ABT5EVR8_9BACT|nr:hypothetical protein [Polyangium mundeleinium]MDC0744866.1 hypothetical protein [Polyangium mundeleinium]
MSRSLPILTLLLALASSCDARRAEPSAAAPTASPSPSAPPALPSAVVAPKEPSPLRAASPFVHLTVPGHPAAVVSLPNGATSRRPVVIAAHGNYGRPEWQCQAVRDLFEDRAFILCPRGIPRDNSPGPDDIRFTYESNAVLELEIDAGLRALAAAYPDHVDPGPPLYMGFSLGAIQGVAIASRRPADFPRLVLIEGGHDAWKPEVVQAFAKGGGNRVLFICSQSFCERDARWAAARLREAKIPTRIVKTADVGHRYNGPVAEATRKSLPWSLEGDARFGDLLPAP